MTTVLAAFIVGALIAMPGVECARTKLTLVTQPQPSDSFLTCEKLCFKQSPGVCAKKYAVAATKFSKAVQSEVGDFCAELCKPSGDGMECNEYKPPQAHVMDPCPPETVTNKYCPMIGEVKDTPVGKITVDGDYLTQELNHWCTISLEEVHQMCSAPLVDPMGTPQTHVMDPCPPETVTNQYCTMIGEVKDTPVGKITVDEDYLTQELNHWCTISLEEVHQICAAPLADELMAMGTLEVELKDTDVKDPSGGRKAAATSAIFDVIKKCGHTQTAQDRDSCCLKQCFAEIIKNFGGLVRAKCIKNCVSAKSS